MMRKLLLPIAFCLSIVQNADAQFGNTPQVLTQSTNANQLGIWTADLDGDGDADLLGAHQVSLIWYENDGTGNFSNDREIMTADMLNSIGFLSGAFEDLDADGRPDLVFDRAWRKNLGGGQFAPQALILANTLATLCDVDADGRPDAVTNDNAKIYWQRNLGSGSFGARQTLLTKSDADVYNLKNLDLDADGRQDFIIRYDNACFWYKNQGNNQFEAIELLASFPGAVSVGHLDNNGKPDLLLGHNPNILWYEVDTDGQKILRQTLPQYYGKELSIGDLDADGDPDIFAGSVGVSGSHRAKYYAFDAATGQFDPVPKPHNTYLLDHDYSEILDLNGDTRPDILVGSTTGPNHFGWLENLTPGSFSGYQNINKKLGLPIEIDIADLENDGDPDIFSVGFVLENLGNGQYAEKRPATAGTGSRAFSGDLDGDGVKDLALPLGDSISWRKGLGNGQFSAPKLLPGLVTSCKQVGGGDLDNDGDLDLFAANGTDALAVNARFYWFENDGAGNFTGHLLETGIQFCSNAFALDANEDGLPDMGLLFFNGYSPRLYLNLGNGVFATPTSLFPAGTPSPSNVNQEMLTDLDGDGRPDYVYCTRDYTQTKVAWYQNLGTAGFSGAKTLVTMTHAGYAVPRFCVFDADLDGITDVMVCDNSANRFLFVRGLGNSAFAAAVTVYDEPNFGNFVGVAAHDVDGDGKLDIVYGSDTDYLYNLNGYNRLSWLQNLTPAPAPALQIVLKNSSCHDNDTPLDATDDREVLRFMVVPIGDAAASGQYVLYDEVAQIPLDTFSYGVLSVYALPPGTAGTSFYALYSFRDVMHPDLKKEFAKPSIAGCSPEAPAAIGVNRLQVRCDDAGTAIDPTDDRIRIELTAAKYNGGQGLPLYVLESGSGVPESIFDGTNVGLYTFPEVFLLPPGSAAVPGQVTLTLRDSTDQSISKMLVFDNPGVCSDATLAALLSGNGNICAGDSAELRLLFVGDPPFTFVLTENGVPQLPVTTVENPYTFVVSPAAETVYSLQSISNAQGSGLANGTVSIAVFPPLQPAITAPDSVCLGDTVVLTALGGLDFSWNTGETTAQIEAQPTVTTTYTVTVSDGNACTAVATWTVAVETCISSVFSPGNGAENTVFQVFPNPLPEDESLQVLLENDFRGQVKIEILSLDGRILHTEFREKTGQRAVFGLPKRTAPGGSFFVRVSDGRMTASQLVLKL